MARHERLLLHEHFEAQTRRTPDRVALYDNQQSITFANLQGRSDRLAWALRGRGIREGCCVGLHLERSIDYVVSLLAVLKSNGSAVPLPPSYPETRLRDILSFAALDAVIDHADTPLPTPSPNDNVIRFPDSPGDLQEASGATPGSPDQPAFVLCSSGSTGKPKMIVRSHRSFFHRLTWTWDHHPYAAGELCCQKSFMTTTHAIYELFEPMLRGVPVLILSDEAARDLGRLWNTITARGISRLLIVPSVLQASLDIPGFVAPSLRVLVLMGEYVHPRLAERVIKAFPEETRSFSIYGTTEASSTLVCDLRESFRAGEELPLGKPITPQVRAYVLGTNLQPVGRGEVGILHLAGSALFREYFKSPALTASVLADAPDGDGFMYNTHDQVRLAPDGNLHFVGRIDHTVKIRGFRVDLQEVERTLLLHPEVSQAAVVVSESAPGESMLLGFYVPGTVDQVSAFRVLRERLPGYMVPSALVGRDSLPTTPNGKVDRLKLLEEYASSASEGRGGRDPSGTESKVLAVWRSVLKHADLPLDRSFFEVGGSSLSVFAVLHRLRETFALDRSQLSDQAIYQFPTIEGLASHLDRLRSGSATVASSTDAILVTLKKGDDSGLPPLFVVSSPGGTLGAYHRLTRALRTKREVVGVRDPFVWGERDPTMGFQRWVGLYTSAILERQPTGPYYLGAYSSAGAFGYEVAQQLRRAGHEVALLALIDPLGMDCRSKRRFGYWALEARRGRPLFRQIVLLARRLGLARLGVKENRGQPGGGNDDTLTKEELLRLAARAKTNNYHILGFSALLELNTELPFALRREALSGVAPAQCLGVLLARVKSVAPEVDPQSIENMVVQYYLQTRAQNVYRLQRFEGKVVLFEPDGPYVGLLASQLRPYVAELRAFSLRLGEQDENTRVLAGYFDQSLRSHYLCMRDDGFVNGLSEQLDRLLR